MKPFLIILTIALILIPFFPAPAEAFDTCPFPGCFGGFARAQTLCTCSNNFLVFFTPLFFSNVPAPLAGSLVFQPGTMKYLNYMIIPSVAVVGTYVPGVQACWMYTGHSCVPVPNYGLILPDTGSSLPGAGLGLGGAGVSVKVPLGALTGSLTDNQSDSDKKTSSDTNVADTQTDTSAAPSPAYSKRIVITKGGTYSGAWESADARFPAVDIQTSEPVVITNSFIKSRGPLIRAEGYNANITVTNTRGYGQNPDVDMKVPGRFLSVEGFRSIVVENNYFEGTRGISIVGPKTGAGVIKISNNDVKNIDGRLSGGPGVWRKEDIERYADSSAIDIGANFGQFVQLNKVASSNIEIGWNRVVNEPGKSRTEDVISIYQSSGASGNPILIHDNYIEGSYPLDPTRDVFSGGGIMSGDDAGSGHVVVRDNTVVATTNYGISASAGSDITMTSNRIISSSKLPSGNFIKYNPDGGNVGLVIYSGYGTELVNVSASNNVVGWTMANGARNDWYIPEASSFIGNKHYTSSSVRADGAISRELELAEFALWQKKVADNAVKIGPIK